MNGAWHFREGENIIKQAKYKDLPTDVVIAFAAVARAHFTAALAAATAQAFMLNLPHSNEIHKAWAGAFGQDGVS